MVAANGDENDGAFFPILHQPGCKIPRPTTHKSEDSTEHKEWWLGARPKGEMKNSKNFCLHTHKFSARHRKRGRATFSDSRAVSVLGLRALCKDRSGFPVGLSVLTELGKWEQS